MYTFKHSIGQTALAAVSAAGLICSSCINEDGIPYPNIKANFTSFEVAFQERNSQIDSIQRHVTVFLNDSADISAVTVKGWTLGPEGAKLADASALSKPIDLSDTFNITLEVYRPYVWTISARQTIERYWTIDGQIGQSVIDPVYHTASAVVPDDMPLSSIHVSSLKLAGATAEMSPLLSGRDVDFTQPVQVQVTEFGHTTTWTLTVEQTHLNVSLTDAEAWTGVIWATAAAQNGSNVSFQYRELDSDQWIEVNTADITANGAVFTARINSVKPATSYEVRASLDDEHTTPRTVTTGLALQLPNRNFTDWHIDGSVWYPYAENAEDPFWDTGNKGAATLGKSNVLPIDNPAGGYEGAMLQTRFVGISIIGKLAAGSIFAGKFVRVDGTNGILSFGKPFTQRPTGVRARISYENGPIDYASSDFSDLKGQPDTCTVWCALWDGDEPFEIRTNPKNRQLFDPDDSRVVAYGAYFSGDATDGYIDVDIMLDYRALNRVPKYLLLVSAASKYGDYFTGSTQSTLRLQSYELLYEY